MCTVTLSPTSCTISTAFALQHVVSTKDAWCGGVKVVMGTFRVWIVNHVIIVQLASPHVGADIAITNARPKDDPRIRQLCANIQMSRAIGRLFMAVFSWPLMEEIDLQMPVPSRRQSWAPNTYALTTLTQCISWCKDCYWSEIFAAGCGNSGAVKVIQIPPSCRSITVAPLHPSSPVNEELSAAPCPTPSAVAPVSWVPLCGCSYYPVATYQEFKIPHADAILSDPAIQFASRCIQKPWSD
ncbi:hypothetical protein FISHEDRAFT_59485 [Fistulina hepatica ATCC 64428]|uniref:Uncharacterized protein n=1 Tax=Fistulina hepatica ATCC 64428 TaxID=1128425 RepID=A0A0D7AB33_9AGAR|nr:hypothetical protein FISHEDRAFT_59485 [Fistulina hepatica ATCC 64428]